MTPAPEGRPPLTSAEAMRARLADLPRGGAAHAAPLVSEARWQLRERVVLLDYFTASALSRSAIDGSDAVVTTFIAEDCDLVQTRLGSAWRLRPHVRDATVRRLGARGLQAIAEREDAVAPGPLDVTCVMANALIRAPVDLDALTPDELSGVLRAQAWLAPLGLDLPTVPAISRALEYANVLAPLRSVAREDFVGRSAELAMLGEYLDGETRARGEPVAIHGPGGVGKSSLVSKFVLDRVVRAENPLLFAYLTFDRTELNPEFPLTLIREATRQIALQIATVADLAAALIRDIDHQLAVDMALRNESSLSRGMRGGDTRRGHTDQYSLMSSFARLVGSASGSRPLVLLLDTFEIAQRRHASSLGLLEEALRELGGLLPSLRVVITGRAEATQITHRQYALDGLGDGDARRLLERAVGDLEVPGSLLDDVVDRVSGNPLSLRLAAELMLRQDLDLLSGEGRRRFLFELSQERIQGVLYRRILDHVDSSIRPLANPGLVVRRITPEIISAVLAGPCGLGTISETTARTLFDTLRAEVSLVTEVRPGVLVHRSDVREQMLALLAADDSERVEAIHHAAVAFYGGRAGHDERVEELYHRLMLGQSSARLDKHWDAGAGRSLEIALPELPASSRVYLASKLEIEVSPADLAAADHDAWVRQVTKQGRRLLDAGKPTALLEIIGAAPAAEAIEDSAVSTLWTEALALLGRLDEALEVADAAITEADDDGRLDDFVELSIVAGRVAEDARAFTQAHRRFFDAYTNAVDLSEWPIALTAGAGVLRVARREGGVVQPEDQRLRDEMIQRAAALGELEKSRNPGLLRELAAELSEELPGLLSDAAVYLGVETTSKSDRDLTSHTRSVIDTTAEAYGETASLTFGAPSAPTLQPSAKVGRAISTALNEDGDQELRSSVTEYFRRESDRPSYDSDSITE